MLCLCAVKTVLEDVLETSNFMSLDRKMNRSLVLLMLYDLLIGPSHSIVGSGTVKKLLMQHANHMRTTYVRMKIARGAHGDEDLLPEELRFASRMPRYVRVNTLRSTVEGVHAVLAAEGYTFVSGSKFEVGHSWTTGKEKEYFLDAHIPNLLVFAPGTDLHAHDLLAQGKIILQDKASCMPAAVLDPCAPKQIGLSNGQPWHVLDACAAPGNKTTHLLAIALEHLRKNMPTAANAPTPAAAVEAAPPAAAAAASSSAATTSSSAKKKHRSRGGHEEFDEHDARSGTQRAAAATGRQVDFKLGGVGVGTPAQFKLEAFEVDPTRFQLLHKMMAKALPSPWTSSVPSPLPAATGSAVVCPPCPPATVTLHNRSFLDVNPADPKYKSVTAILLDPTCSGSGMLHRIEQWYKHRVDEGAQKAGKKPAAPAAASAAASASSTVDSSKAEVVENVEALAAFQKEIVSHAMKFPNVQVICYSTCSTHAAEDECVVDSVLSASEAGRTFGLSPALPNWFRRGTIVGQPKGSLAVLTEQEASKCVRVAGAVDGMNGFFVARFLRKQGATAAAGNGAASAATASNKAKQAKSVVAAATPSKPAATKPSKPVPQVTAPAPTVSGQKRKHVEEAVKEADADDAEDDDEMEDEAAAGAASGAPTAGSQSKRNKKKREKAKLKKQKLEQEAAAAKPAAPTPKAKAKSKQQR